MTAGIFHLHGMWVGECKSGNPSNPKGVFENIEIKRRIIEWFGKDLFTIREKKSGFNVDDLIQDRWLMKTAGVFWKIFEDYDPYYVCVRRNKESIVKSFRNVGFFGNRYTDDELREMVDINNEAMDDSQGFNVYTDEVIQGDYSSLREALTGCGLTFDPKIADEFIDRKMWHYEAH